jgi:hypothetical protein
MPWEVEVTDQFQDWYEDLDEVERDAIAAAVEILEMDGPNLGRPLVDTLEGTRHKNLKELRPLEAHFRILFAFGPTRTAILLLGGDKTGTWGAWYKRMIPVAETLYDEHLQELREEGKIP